MREPSLLPVFGKLGIKAPVVAAAAPTMHMRKLLSSHGSLVLKLFVVVWTVLVLAAVFYVTQA